MYSDTILASNPRSAIITLAADNPAPERAQRADAWLMGGPSLAQRVGKSRGRGQIGGGSYADMMVD
jgi:DNA gyrase inhibitor GyrI